MAKEPWYESDDPKRLSWGFGRWFFTVLIVVMALGALIGAVNWFIGVRTSNIAGAGNAVKQKNAADNRIFAQQYFEQQYQTILAADQKVGIAKDALKASPGDPVAQTNYTGVRQFCVDAVAQYDAASRSYTLQDFRAADLPFQIDTLDPQTDCK